MQIINQWTVQKFITHTERSIIVNIANFLGKITTILLAGDQTCELRKITISNSKNYQYKSLDDNF